MTLSPRRLFRILAIAEAVSWTMLLAGLLVRAVGGPAVALTIGGSIHGFVFLSYGATVVLVALDACWRPGPIAIALVSAIVPYATVPVEIWLDRAGRLERAWRTFGEPEDPRWYDRPLRWFLRRPRLLALLLAVAVAVIFTVLLVIGPPGGR